jgi:hypothetical protein
MGPTTLVKLEKDSITVKDRGTDRKGPTEYKLATDAKTSVGVAEVTEERKNDNGTTARGIFLLAGTLADPKVGQSVQVMAVDHYAAGIRVMPPPTPGGEG